jgi:Zinc carboxypeptidase
MDALLTAAKTVRVRLVTALAAALVALAGAANASAAPPWDGTSFSPWLGTPGTTWCAGPAPGTNIDLQQGPPLALIPQEAFRCLLDQFQSEAETAGIPQRMTYSVLPEKTAGGRDQYVVVVNALETPEQQLRYERYQRLRAIELENPFAAQRLLGSWAGEVKMPIFIEANIHGNEEEGADAMMQAIRDLVTLPRGTDPLLDKILDYSVLVVIPNMNPDGRFLGIRQNENRFDMNRDLLVQSQPEVRNNVRVQQQWLATNGLALHGYVNPTLDDGLTKPHNPGMEYDIFLKWNQRRLDDNEARLTAVPGQPGSNGYGMQRPVNDWCSWADHPMWGEFDPFCDAANTPPGPAVAEGWDDWGPFYTQTYISLIGIDGSTVEMCNSTALQPVYDPVTGELQDPAGCGGEGRLGSKKAQYVVFYSSMDYWLDNRAAMMADQVEIYRRGVVNAARPRCCDDPLIASRGFDEANHNWMVEYPTAYVIPRNRAQHPRNRAQRSNAEANRLVRWLLDNGIEVTTAKQSFRWSGQTFLKGSYVVWMNQALRGLALTALSAGQDISSRISVLYAPPGAWSHGLVWGADVYEVPRGERRFRPQTREIRAPLPLRGVVHGRSSRDTWYAATIRGTIEARAILGLLRSGVDAELAEAPFRVRGGKTMPAGSLIFPGDRMTANALRAAAGEAGIRFNRGIGAKPARTVVARAPKIGVLVDSATPEASTTTRPIFEGLEAVFGPDVTFVSTVTGPNSLQSAASDPLAGIDVLYNTGVSYPASPNDTARARLAAFFARGGGYIGTGQSATNFTFLTDGGLVDAFVRGLDDADGGIALWNNVGGAASPITGAYPARDTLFLPADMTYFSTVPSGAVVDGRYLESTDALFVAGLWRDRDAVVASAPVIVHGNTTASSRYMGFATDPFSRMDAEREWPLIAQAALWSNLTDG